jgi:hypothetical protein
MCIHVNTLWELAILNLDLHLDLLHLDLLHVDLHRNLYGETRIQTDKAK